MEAVPRGTGRCRPFGVVFFPSSMESAVGPFYTWALRFYYYGHGRAREFGQHAVHTLVWFTGLKLHTHTHMHSRPPPPLPFAPTPCASPRPAYRMNAIKRSKSPAAAHRQEKTNTPVAWISLIPLAPPILRFLKIPPQKIERHQTF